MKLQLSAILLFFFTSNLFSQDAFLVTGKNFTNYEFENSLGQSNPKINGGSGTFYEVGIAFNLDNWLEGLSYAPSFALNQYNASGGDFNTTYRWNTNYLGLNNMLKFNLLHNSDSVDLTFKVGVGVATLVNGQQSINGLTYDLLSSDEFKGIWIQPSGGFELVYNVTPDIGIGTGYSYTKAFGGVSDIQTLRISNSQILFLINVNFN